MIVQVTSTGEIIVTGDVLEEKCHFVHHTPTAHPTWTGLGWNLGLHVDTAVINRSNHGKVNKPWAFPSTLHMSQTNNLYININVVMPVAPNFSTTKDILLSLPSLYQQKQILCLLKYSICPLHCFR